MKFRSQLYSASVHQGDSIAHLRPGAVRVLILLIRNIATIPLAAIIAVNGLGTEEISISRRRAKAGCAIVSANRCCHVWRLLRRSISTGKVRINILVRHKLFS